MKASELRIGNLVLDSTKTTTRVENIVYGEHERVRYGIPLTKEWLLKFGFEPFFEGSSGLKLTIKYADENSPCTLQTSGSGICICKGGSYSICVDVKYVHQLQNLYFSLIGEEINIKSPVTLG